jgi:hypothetical protein
MAFMRVRSRRRFLLYGTPELVHTDQYTSNYIARVDEPELLKPEGSSANFAWLTRDIAPSGVMGDPTAATAENGEQVGERGGQEDCRNSGGDVSLCSKHDLSEQESPKVVIDCGNGVRLERGVRCTLSDGVTLVSDHYYPAVDLPGRPWPTLLMRQPYGRDIASTVVYAHPVWFARQWLSRCHSGCARAW